MRNVALASHLWCLNCSCSNEASPYLSQCVTPSLPPLPSLPPPSLPLSPSFHVGSNSKNPQVFPAALEMSHQLFVFGESLGFIFNILDIGGGFPGLLQSASRCWVNVFFWLRIAP